MRSVLLASVFSAGLIWLALGSAPAESQANGKAASCQACGESAACPHCAAGKDCPHCSEGKTCPHCAEGKACPHCKQGKACAHCGKGHPHHGHWGSHTWEYKCVRPAKKPEAMTQQFSGLGDQGWRLVEADGGVWCFSRMKRTE
jgi:hypothetical protein